MGLFHNLSLKDPTLKRRLIIAHIKRTPEEYVREKFISAIMMSFVITLCAFIISFSMGYSMIIPVIAFIVAFPLLYKLFISTVDVAIHKHAKLIDREVIFAGRFLLVKLHAGSPLINAIVEASNSFGVANQSFKEIVRDIDLGTPLEEALEHASRYNPSENFRRIVFNITNALKIGVDVTSYLEAIIDEIAETQLIGIQRYGKKMSGYTMFYMLFAIVVPSLGITLLITVASFMNFVIDTGFFLMLLTLLLIIQFVFITIFKSARPNVNL